MKKLSILVGLIIAFVFSTNAQTPTAVQFEKGASEKTLTITVKAGGTNKYSVSVKKEQVINFGVEGDINVSKATEFPVISINLDNGVEKVDNWQDGEGYLSILAGKNGKYIVSVSNSDKKRTRTFKLKVKVTNDKGDFAGGEEVDQ
ncbi:MAG: hypothetical protein AAB336_06190 [Acidobacteriota bacterium]